MSLREQFEAWGRKEFPPTWDMQTKAIEQEKRNLWQAYQAGNAVNAELLEALEAVFSWHCEVNETLDESQLPKEIVEKLQAEIKKARAE